MPHQTLTAAQVASYHKDGYVMVKNFCTAAEVDKLYTTALQDDAMRKNALDLNDQSGKKTSSYPRWSVISCYTLQSNLAYNETSTSWKTPVAVVPDEAMLSWEAESLSTADFLKKEAGPALKETGWEKEVTVQ